MVIIKIIAHYCQHCHNLVHLLPMFSRLSVLSTLCCFLLFPMLSKLSVIPRDPPTTGVRFSAEDLLEKVMTKGIWVNLSLTQNSDQTSGKKEEETRLRV